MTRIEISNSPPAFTDENDLTDCLNCLLATGKVECFIVLDRRYVIMESRSVSAVVATVRGNPALWINVQFKG